MQASDGGCRKGREVVAHTSWARQAKEMGNVSSPDACDGVGGGEAGVDCGEATGVPNETAAGLGVGVVKSTKDCSSSSDLS